jgi:hypothetical protein
VSGEKLEKWKVFGGGILGAYTVSTNRLWAQFWKSLFLQCFNILDIELKSILMVKDLKLIDSSFKKFAHTIFE